MLATVIAEPFSLHYALFESTTIADYALSALNEVKEDLDPEEYAAAKLAGTSRSSGDVSKDLIESLSKVAPSMSS